MKRFTHIPGTLVDQITFYLVLSLFISLPLDRFFSEIVFIIFIIHTLINLDINSLKRLTDPLLLVVQSVFILSVIGCFYGADRHSAFNECSIQLPILIVPLLFAIHRPLLIKYKQYFFDAFTWSCVIVVTYLFGVVFATMAYFHLPVKGLYSESFINHNFSLPVGIHATFFSALVVLALVNLLPQLSKQRTAFKKFLLYGVLLMLLASLVQLSSKTAIISLLLMINIFLPLYYFNGVKRWLSSALLWLITLSGLAVVCFAGNLRERLLTDLDNDLNISKNQLVTDSRLNRWKVALETASHKPVLGYGTGDEQQVMHQAYFDHKMYHSFIFRLNAHNQFLSLLIKHGILGLALFIATLIYGFVLAIRNRDIMLTALLVLMVTASVSENVLDANKGILMYSLFFSLPLLAKAWVTNLKSSNKMLTQATHAPFFT